MHFFTLHLFLWQKNTILFKSRIYQPVWVLQKYGNHRAEYLVLSSITQTVSRVRCATPLWKNMRAYIKTDAAAGRHTCESQLASAGAKGRMCACQEVHCDLVKLHRITEDHIRRPLWTWWEGFRAQSARREGFARTPADAQAHANFKKLQQCTQHRCFCC